jgi:Phage derived protein Gp49-like (DUF891)
MWSIKAFTADYETTVVSTWFHAQSEAVQAAFEIRLDFLKVRPPSVWQRPYVGTLRGECKGLFEIRLEVGNVQYRPIGYYAGELQFTILAFATERDSKLVPASVCALAKRRKTLIEQDWRHAREFKIED